MTHRINLFLYEIRISTKLMSLTHFLVGPFKPREFFSIFIHRLWYQSKPRHSPHITPRNCQP